MKPILLIFMASVLLVSCASYQYYALSGENINKDNNHDFIYENDTLKVVYNFNGQGCPVKVSILNKLSEPLKIDWQRSAVIYNGQSFSFYNHTYALDATINGTTSRSYNGERSLGTSSNSTVDGTIIGKEKEDYIPPSARIASNVLRVPVRSLERISFDTLKKQFIKVDKATVGIYKSLDFNSVSSPVLLRSYLYFNIGKDEKAFVVEHKFFVSKVWKTETTYLNLSDYKKDMVSDFYL